MVVKKLKDSAPAIVKRTAKAAPAAEWEFELPSQRSKPPESLAGYSTLIYGEAGIGKTSLVKEFGKVLFFTWESASEAISVYRTPLLNDEPEKKLFGWQKAMKVAEALEKNKGEFTAVCFDTVKPAYDACLNYVCHKEGITHPGEMNDFGASWGKVAEEYKRLNDYLRGLGLAVISIAHEKIEDKETRAGKKFCLLKPAISGQCEAYYRSTTAIIAYYYKMGNQRWLQLVGDDYVTAKSNPENNFRTSKGERIERVPMGDSAAEGYKNFVTAFVNKQTEPYPAADGGIAVVKEMNSRTGKFNAKATKTTR